MPTRIPASERTSQKLDELLTQGVADGDARAELLKLAVRKIVEEALEAEVAEAVGRGYYENGAAPGAGYRNGYRRGRLPTAEGAIEYGVPQVADRRRAVRLAGAGPPGGAHRGAGAAGGGDVRARAEHPGHRSGVPRRRAAASVLSRTAVSQVTERLWQEYEAFASRDLSEFAVAYLFVDGVAERLHAGLPREAVLCAWGITEDGRKVLLHLAPGTKEDTASCTAFFEDSSAAGLADPLLVVTDGAPGLIRAVETCFPRALRQRCLVHRLRNLQSKAPESQWPEIACGPAAVTRRRRRRWPRVLREDFVETYERELPAVVRASATTSTPASPICASRSGTQGDADHESARAAVPRGAPADQGHPARVRRAAGAEADVRGGDPRRRAMARDRRRRIRAATTASDPRRARPRSRGARGTGRHSQTDDVRPKTSS